MSGNEVATGEDETNVSCECEVNPESRGYSRPEGTGEEDDQDHVGSEEEK